MLPKPRSQPYCPRNQVKNEQIFLFLNFNTVLDGYILVSNIIGECIVECNLKKLQNSVGSVFGATRCVASLGIGTKRKSLYCILLSVLGTNLDRCNRSRLCVFLIFNYCTVLFKPFPSYQ